MSEQNQQEEETGRQWSEEYCIRSMGGIQQPAQTGVRYPCPCCGYPTLHERGLYELCELCNWEYDGQDDPHADEVWGGPNYQYSLTQAREKFKRFWIMYSPNNPAKSGRGNSPAAQEVKEAIVAAFDAMPNAEDDERTRLWDVVQAGEKALRQELHSRVQEMEAAAKSANAVPNE